MERNFQPFFSIWRNFTSHIVKYSEIRQNFSNSVTARIAEHHSRVLLSSAFFCLLMFCSVQILEISVFQDRHIEI